MDPFERTVLKLIAKKIMEARACYMKRDKDKDNDNEECDDKSTDTDADTDIENKNKYGKDNVSMEIKPSIQNDPLPYNISKHVQYMKQEEYMRKRKALKKQSDIV